MSFFSRMVLFLFCIFFFFIHTSHLLLATNTNKQQHTRSLAAFCYTDINMLLFPMFIKYIQAFIILLGTARKEWWNKPRMVVNKRMCVCACVYEIKREREGEKVCVCTYDGVVRFLYFQHKDTLLLAMCLYVCVFFECEIALSTHTKTVIHIDYPSLSPISLYLSLFIGYFSCAVNRFMICF